MKKTLPSVTECLRRIVDLFPEQICPLEDLCELVAISKLALEKQRKTRSKQGSTPAEDRGRPSVVTADLLDQITGLRALGNSAEAIAREVGVSPSTVRNAIHGRLKIGTDPAKKTAQKRKPVNFMLAKPLHSGKISHMERLA